MERFGSFWVGFLGVDVEIVKERWTNRLGWFGRLRKSENVNHFGLCQNRNWYKECVSTHRELKKLYVPKSLRLLNCFRQFPLWSYFFCFITKFIRELLVRYRSVIFISGMISGNILNFYGAYFDIPVCSLEIVFLCIQELNQLKKDQYLDLTKTLKNKTGIPLLNSPSIFHSSIFH